MAEEKILNVTMNIQEQFSTVKGKATAGANIEREFRELLSAVKDYATTQKIINRELEKFGKQLAQLSASIGRGAPTAAGPARAQEQARKKLAEELKKTGDEVKKSTKKAAKEIEDGGKRAKKSVEDSAGEFAKALEREQKSAQKRASEGGKIESELRKAIGGAKDVSKETQEAVKETKRAAKEASNAAEEFSKTVDKIKAIPESARRAVEPLRVPRIDRRMAEIDKMMARFGGSLHKLTQTLEEQARATARRSRGRLEVLGTPGAAFKVGERELKLEIAEVSTLVKSLEKVSERLGERFERGPGQGAEELLGELRTRVAREIIRELPDLEKQADAVAKALTRETGKIVKATEILGKKTETEIARVEDLFNEKVIEAEFRKLRNEIVKTLTLPRVQATPETGPFIESRTGAQKGVIRFAELETGLDRLFKAVQSNFKDLASAQNKSINDVKAEFKNLKLEIVKEMTKEGGADVRVLDRLLADLTRMLVTSNDKNARLVREGIARAIATAEAREAGGVTKTEFEKRRKELLDLPIEDLRKTFKTVKDELGVSVRDVVASLDRLKIQNVYDRILKNLEAVDRQGVSNMKRFFQNLERGYISAFRDFERGITAVTDLLPQVAPNLPKAGVAARETVAVITTPPRQVRQAPGGEEYVTERAQRRYLPEFTQREIVELNQRLKKYVDDLMVTGRELDENIQRISTLGVSESVGATINQLEDLNQVFYKMSTLDLTKLAPFGEQFANAARAMHQTMRALSGPLAELPRLQTRTEQGLIRGGAFGQQGFGYNVVTELRHTADTFEDQIEIGGKLARAITETTRKLIVPAGTVPEDLMVKKIDEVGNEIIKLLGAREEVKFSADEAFLRDIKEATTVVTGQDVDIQIAQIAEKFLAQFGRKITTRGATKGLATFPLAAAAAGGAKVGLAEEALGTARVPKTMGELASELIENALGPNTEQELKESLINAGNKFFIDVFTGAESVLGEEEGKRLQNLLNELNKILGTKFRATAAGVEKFRMFYTETMEELGKTAESLFKDIPIEARLSLRGVAKRGVQSDILEVLANNLTGAVETVLPDAVDVEKFLGKGRKKGVFEKYLKALGYIQEEGERLAAYTEVMEKGRARRGIVGEQFLQIIEEPHLKAPWEEEDIERGLKGLRVNLQAFAALSSVFGEQSAYIKEIAEASRVASDEARELIMAASLMGDKFAELRPKLRELIDVVDIGDIRVFEKATGTFEDMKGTILDLQKFAKPFLLSFPEAIGGGATFVPGAAARKTYPEALTGGRGPIGLARRLDLVVEAAQEAAKIAGGFGKTAELIPSEDIVKNFERVIDKWINRIEEQVKDTPSEKIIKESFNELMSFLSSERFVPAVFTPTRARGAERFAPITETETIQRSLTHKLGLPLGTNIETTRFSKIPRNVKTIARIYADVGRQIRDIVVGSETWSEEIRVINQLLERMKETGEKLITPELLEGLVPDPEETAKSLQNQMQGYRKFARDIGKTDIPFLEEKVQKQIERTEYTPKVQQLVESTSQEAEDALRKFADQTKVEVERFSEEALQRAIQRLSRARAQYATELSQSLLGKGGAVDIALFQKQLPAARAQVVNLNVNKIPELEAALAELEKLDAGTGELAMQIEGLRGVIEEQKRLMSEAAAEGRPFLREGEVLIPPEKAKLLGDEIERGLKEGAEVFVETVRFPVTGAPSFQPARARLMAPEMAAAAPSVFALPGRAPIDIDKVAEFLQPLNDKIKQTRAELDGLDAQVREGILTEDQATEQRAALTMELERLKEIVTSTTTKFAPFEQNLDFDGDAIFIHAAKTKEAADEIKKHYEALRGMDKDIYAVRQAIFNVVNAIQEKDIEKLADVAGIFAKQFPEERGFGFLKRPGPRAGVEELTRQEVENAIVSYLGPGAAEKIAEKIGKNVADATDKELKTYLQNLKLAEDIVKLVGHKIGIGMVTENLNRIARAAEVIVGAGGGIAGGGEPPMGRFIERWQPGAALGADPAREFQFRLNDLLRFGINAAFKTKHGGGSIYEELVGILTEETGAERLRREIESGKGPFAELANVNEAIAETVRDRLRALSPEMLVKEAKRFGIRAGGRERKTIIDDIVKRVDLPGFVEELFKTLSEAAIEAQKVEVLRELKPGEVETIAPAEVERVAKERFEQRLAERKGRIDIREDITEILQPLYQLRTSAADLNSIFNQFGDMFQQDVPQWAQASEELQDRFRKAAVVADHMVRSMQEAASGLTASNDTVTAMMKIFADELTDITKKQREFAKEFKIPTAPGKEVDIEKLQRRFFVGRGLTGEEVTPRMIKAELARTMEMLGIRDIPGELKDVIKSEVLEFARQRAEAGEEVTREQMEMVETVRLAQAQLQRIVDELQAISFREATARELIPQIAEFTRAGTRELTPPDIVGGPPPGTIEELQEKARKMIEKALGKKTTEKVIEAYGGLDPAIDKITNSMDELQEITGIGAKTIEKLKGQLDVAKLEEVASTFRDISMVSGEISGGMRAVRDPMADLREAMADTGKTAQELSRDIKETKVDMSDLMKGWHEEIAEMDREIQRERAEEVHRREPEYFDPSGGRVYKQHEIAGLPEDVINRLKKTEVPDIPASELFDDAADVVKEKVDEVAKGFNEAVKETVTGRTAKIKSGLQAAMAGGAAGGGAGGDDGDGDDEDYKKKLAELNRAWQDAANIPDVEKRIKKLDEIVEKLAMLKETIATQDPANAIVASIEASINAVNLLKNAADPEKLMASAKKAAAFDPPKITDDIITNLRLLQDLAQETHRLYDDVWAVPEFVKDILERIRSEGPRRERVEEFREALEEANVSGLEAAEAWKRYHLAKVEYYLRTAEQFKQLSIEAEDMAKTSEYARRAGAAAGQAQAAIRGSYRGRTPYLTDEPRARYGTRGRYISPELAAGAGVTVDPRILRAQVSEYAQLNQELEGILDKLVEIDPDKMKAPLQKARDAFDDLTMAATESGEMVGKAFDLSYLAENITVLRGAVEDFLFRNIDLSETQRENIRATITFLKDLEKQYARLGTALTEQGILKVPKWLDPDVQRELHQRNVRLLREMFQKPVGEGGLEDYGRRLNYIFKVFDEGGNVVDHFVFKFRKLGDAITSQGERVGRFSEEMDDMIKNFSERRGLGQAFRRVIAWGAAATVVYGTVRALRDMVDTISDVEMGMIQLRKVMNPVTTDFEMMQRQAVQFAKEFGAPIRDVIASMKVFAQQGLNQVEVLDRARTSVLAGNVTLLQAADATEALTSATKQFTDEGYGSVRFLDSWIEVAARHAITSKDLALALQRAGAAAKNAGIEFDELNAIVTAIGAISRQTGREIGTSVRFFARRLTAQKAPRELAKVGVEAFLPTGEVRPAFEILEELAMRWSDLSDAQRLSISLAIGGRRHYNAILILMQNWQEAVEALAHSQNSQGSAMRRNQIVMESFQKRVEQLRQSVIETQLAFGKFALPVAKGIIDSMRSIVEAINEIPDSIKIASLALGGLLVLAHKGATVVDRFADAWSKLTGLGQIGFTGGAGRGLASITTALKGITAAESIYDVNSALGKLVFILLDVGRAYNAFLGNLAGSAAIFGIVKTAVVSAIAVFTGFGGVAAGVTRTISTITIPALAALSFAFKSLSDTGTGVIGSLVPLAATIYGLYNVLKPVVQGFLEANKTASEFAEEQENNILLLQENVKQTNELARSIKKLSDEYENVAKGTADITPETFVKRTTELRRSLGDLIATQIPSAVTGFNEFGYAITESTDDLFELSAGIINVNDALLKVKIKEIASRFNHELTAMNEGMERTKYGLRELAEDIPILGEKLASKINVAPIIDLRESIKDVQNILAERRKYPFTNVFEEFYQEALKNMMDARQAVEASVAGMEEAISKLPKGATTEEYVRSLREFKDELETLARFRSAEIGLDIDWEDVLAVRAFRRAGINIQESAELTYDALIETGKKAKRPLADIKAEFEKAGKDFEQAVQQGLDPRAWEFRTGDIILFAEDYAKEFGIASGHALLQIRDTTEGMGEMVIQFLDESTQKWAELDFSDRIRDAVMAVFSPVEFEEAATESVDVISKILAGAAAGIEYPVPIELGPRYFSQVGTPELLTTGFGRFFGKPIGTTEFGRPEYKETFEIDYGKLRRALSDYQKELEVVEKINQERLDGEAAISSEIADRIRHIQDIIMHETAIANFAAVVEDMAKAFEDADRALQDTIRNEEIRAELLRRTSGLFTGMRRDIPALPQPAITLDDAAVQDIAYATSSRFRELIDAYSETETTMEALLERMQMIEKAQADLRYLQDLYEANSALIDEMDFDEYVREVALTGDKSAARVITAIKGVENVNKEDLMVAKEMLRLQQGLPEEAQEFEPNERMEKALRDAGGYTAAALAGAFARGEGAFGDPIAAMQFAADDQKKAGELFNYAAGKLSELPLGELLREYKAALREVGLGPRGERIGVGTGLTPGGPQGTAITRLFTQALGRRLGEQAYGENFLRLAERIIAERAKIEGPGGRPIEVAVPEELFLDLAAITEDNRITVQQLREISDVNLRSAANIDKLLVQLGTIGAAFLTRRGSQLAGIALGGLAGARVGEALGIGRIRTGLIGSFIGDALADMSEEQIDQKKKLEALLETNRGEIAKAVAAPQGQKVEGFDQLLNESTTQTDLLKIIAERMVGVKEFAKLDLKEQFDKLTEARDVYNLRQDIFDLFKSAFGTAAVTVLAGLVGGPVEEAALPERMRRQAIREFEQNMQFLLENIEVIEKLAPEIGTDMEAAVSKMKEALKEPEKTTESEIRDAFAVFNQLTDLLKEEAGFTRQQIVDVFKQQKLTTLEAQVIVFEKQLGQELLRIANEFKGADMAREIRNEFESAFTGFLRGMRFPGAIEPGRPERLATAEERVFAAMPRLYEGFVEGQQRLASMAQQIQAFAQEMAKLDTQIQSGTGNTDLAREQYRVLAEQQDAVRSSANQLKDALGRMKETLDEALLIEQLRVNIQDMLFGLKKFNDIIKDIDTTSIEMARREHPLAEVQPEWETKDFWRRGMDQFELEMERIRKERGFLPIDDRRRIQWQREEALIQRQRQQELESFNQEIETAKSIYSELYDYQQKWGVDVKDIMQTLRYELERAGDVVFRGGQREFRGVPSLDRLQDRMAELAQEVRNREFQEQHDVLMTGTETLLAAAVNKLGEIKQEVVSLQSASTTVNVETSGGMTQSDIQLKILEAYPEYAAQMAGGKQDGGRIRGPGGPKSDSIPAWLSDGEYVIKADSVNKLGTGILDYLNKHGEMPGFAAGGFNVPRAKATSGRGMTHRSVREYNRNLRDWERSGKGFDPERFVETWPFEDMTFAEKLMKRRELEAGRAGISIRGLAEVLSAASESGRYHMFGGFFNRGVSPTGGIETLGFLPGVRRRRFQAGGYATPYELKSNMFKMQHSKADYESGMMSQAMPGIKSFTASATETAFRTGKGQLSLYDIYDENTIKKMKKKTFKKRLDPATAEKTLRSLDPRQLDVIMDLFETEGPEYALRALLNLRGGSVARRGGGIIRKPMRYQDGSPGKPDTRAADALRKWLLGSGKIKLTTLPSGSYNDFFDALDAGDVSTFAKYSTDKNLVDAVLNAYEAGTFTPAELKAAQDAIGQSVTELKTALGFRYGGLMTRRGLQNRYNIGGMLRRRYQNGGLVDVGANFPDVIEDDWGMYLKSATEKLQRGNIVDTGLPEADIQFFTSAGEVKTKEALASLLPFHQYFTKEGRELLAAEPFERRAQILQNEAAKLVDYLIGAGEAVPMLLERRALKSATLDVARLSTTEVSDALTTLNRGLRAELDPLRTARTADELFNLTQQTTKADLMSPDIGKKVEGLANQLVGNYKFLRNMADAGDDEALKFVKQIEANLEALSKTYPGRSLTLDEALELSTRARRPEQATKELLETAKKTPFLDIEQAVEAEKLALRLEKAGKLERAEELYEYAYQLRSGERTIGGAYGEKQGLRLSTQQESDELARLAAHEKLHERFQQIRNNLHELSLVDPDKAAKLRKSFEVLERNYNHLGQFADPKEFKKIQETIGRSAAYKGKEAEETAARVAELLPEYRLIEGVKERVAVVDGMMDDLSEELGLTAFPFRGGGLANMMLRYRGGGMLEKIMMGMGGMMRKIPSYQGGGVVEETGLAFLHKDEEVKTPAQRVADRMLRSIEVDTDAIQNAVEEGIKKGMEDSEVKFATEEVTAKLDTDTVKLDTTEITVKVESTATAGGDIQAFMDNNNARISALEGQTTTFNDQLTTHDDELMKLSEDLNSLDISSNVELFNEIEQVRTDLKMASSEFEGRFTTIDNQLTFLRQDLTRNYNEHLEIKSTAQTARSSAERANAKIINLS